MRCVVYCMLHKLFVYPDGASVRQRRAAAVSVDVYYNNTFTIRLQDNR